MNEGQEAIEAMIQMEEKKTGAETEWVRERPQGESGQNAGTGRPWGVRGREEMRPMVGSLPQGRGEMVELSLSWGHREEWV